MNGQPPPVEKTWEEIRDQQKISVANLKKELIIQEAILKEVELNLK